MRNTYVCSFTRMKLAPSNIPQFLSEVEESITSYKKALSLLPTSSLSLAEKKQKATYEVQIKRAESFVANLNIVGPQMLGKRPGIKAAAMIPQLSASGDVNSSVSRSASSTYLNQLKPPSLKGLGNTLSSHG